MVPVDQEGPERILEDSLSPKVLALSIQFSPPSAFRPHSHNLDNESCGGVDAMHLKFVITFKVIFFI